MGENKEKVKELEKTKKIEVKDIKKDETKKSHVILITILIVLLLIAFFGFGYALGGTGIVNKVKKQQETKETKKDTSKDKTKEETKNDDSTELDINSRLVQFLYNEVTYDPYGEFCNIWEYEKGEEKINLLGRNINKIQGKFIQTSEIPDYSNYSKGSTEGETKSYYFTKDYIERIYKQLFGKAATLDTSKDIIADGSLSSIYHYDEKSQRYYPYYRIGGSVCGGESEKATLDKATLEGNTLKIYQAIEYKKLGETEINEKYNYVYTFEKEDDGMYKFIGRTKEK